MPKFEVVADLPEEVDPGVDESIGEWVIQEIPRIHGSSLCEGSCVRGARRCMSCIHSYYVLSHSYQMCLESMTLIRLWICVR